MILCVPHDPAHLTCDPLWIEANRCNVFVCVRVHIHVRANDEIQVERIYSYEPLVQKGDLIVHDLVGLFFVLFIAYLVFRLVKVDEFREFERLGKLAFKKALKRINTRLDKYVNSPDND